VTRLAVALSVLVVVAWFVLSAAAWWSTDDLVGIALLVLALCAVAALAVIWLAFVLVRSLLGAFVATRELRG
jgi:hypothetical protein